MAVVLTAWHWRAESRTVKITVLPLNGGDAVFVDCPGRLDDLLIDCGNENSFEFILKPFLRAQGINRLETILLTHGDLKHIGGLAGVKENFSFQKIVTSPIASRSAAYREIIFELKTKPEELRSVKNLTLW